MMWVIQPVGLPNTRTKSHWNLPTGDQSGVSRSAPREWEAKDTEGWEYAAETKPICVIRERGKRLFFPYSALVTPGLFIVPENLTWSEASNKGAAVGDRERVVVATDW
jgi:hypothetical protein